MTDRSTHETDLKLRRLLQDGDPAADNRDPDPAELNRWRRKTLAAAGLTASLIGGSVAGAVLLPTGVSFAQEEVQEDGGYLMDLTVGTGVVSWAPRRSFGVVLS